MAPPGMLDIVLEEGGGFGAGTHPTTRTCLELLIDIPAAGSFASVLRGVLGKKREGGGQG